MKKNLILVLKIFLSLIFTSLFAVFFVEYIHKTNNYPLGSDVYGHLFKSQFLYEEILKGNFFPKYSPYWYNGVELFRYWPPGVYYIVSGFLHLTGNIYDSYLCLLFVCVLISGLGFIFLGVSENRLFVSSIVSVLYFMNPDNLRVLFDEGNLPRIFINACLPFIFYFVYRVLKYKKVICLLPLGIFIMIVTYTHFMISAMIGVSIFIYGLIFSIANKGYKYFIYVIIDLFLSYISMAFILIPGLTGGLVSNQSSSSEGVAALWSQEIYKSLNPFIRYESLGLYYFGLSIFIILLIGLFIGNKNILPNFLTTILIFLSTSVTASKLIRMLPMNQLFWMQRFIPIALLLFFFGIVLWKNCRKVVLALFFALIILDIIPSLRFITVENFRTPNDFSNFKAETILLDKAVEVSNTKIAVMDLSKWGSFPSYYLTNNPLDKDVIGLFGWAIQGATDEENIVNLNESFEKGFYTYMFDRFIVYGADTVLFKKSEILYIDELEETAKKFSFEKITENDEAILYKNTDINETYGTISDSKNIAIGNAAEYICYIYPSFERGNSDNLDDYSFEELKKYNKIYLSDFDYSDEEKASALLTSLANNGVKIFVDMNKTKLNKVLGKGSFMGVDAEEISFSDTFPVLTNFEGNQFKLSPITENYKEWKTFYLRKTPEILFKTNYRDLNFTYVGSDKTKNIYYIGLNLVYYYYETGDKNLGKFLDNLFEMNKQTINTRQIVPISIQYNKDSLIIKSEFDNVNTNITGLSCFDETKSINNFIVVNKGNSYFEVGKKNLSRTTYIIISVFGFSFLLSFILYVFILERESKYKKI